MRQQANAMPDIFALGEYLYQLLQKEMAFLHLPDGVPAPRVTTVKKVRLTHLNALSVHTTTNLILKA